MAAGQQRLRGGQPELQAGGEKEALWVETGSGAPCDGEEGPAAGDRQPNPPPGTSH